ncbi:MAG: hypothetical protein ACK5LY_00330 [Lachnospirales bacterium]
MNRKDLKKEIEKHFAYSKPIRKEEFLQKINVPSENIFTSFATQIEYISKKFWVLSFLIIIFSLYILKIKKDSLTMIFTLSSILPVLTVFVIDEISKTVSYNMAELEMSCKNDLQKITFIRMAIMSTFHFFVMLGIFAIFSYNVKINIIKIAMIGILPYMVVCYISLLIINNFNFKDKLYMCYGVSFFVSTLVYIYSENDKLHFLYNENLVLLITTIILIALVLKESVILIKERKDVQWHLKLKN